MRRSPNEHTTLEERAKTWRSPGSPRLDGDLPKLGRLETLARGSTIHDAEQRAAPDLSEGLVHRDLSQRNILLREPGVPVVGPGGGVFASRPLVWSRRAERMHRSTHGMETG